MWNDTIGLSPAGKTATSSLPLAMTVQAVCYNGVSNYDRIVTISSDLHNKIYSIGFYGWRMGASGNFSKNTAVVSWIAIGY